MGDGGSGGGGWESGSVRAAASTGPPSARRSAGVHAAASSFTVTWPGPGGGAVAAGLSSSFSTLSKVTGGQQASGSKEGGVLELGPKSMSNSELPSSVDRDQEQREDSCLADIYTIERVLCIRSRILWIKCREDREKRPRQQGQKRRNCLQARSASTIATKQSKRHPVEKSLAC